MSYEKKFSFIMHKNDSIVVENYGDKNKLQKLLELLNTTYDVDFNSKILSALSGYLIFSNRFNIDKIIKCNILYDKIYNIVSKGSPRKATDALNFLSALLYVDADEETTTRKALALYARNMTRVSGCLGAMSEMFCSNMYLDTWKALCQCLAVACGDCEVNQSYCTHLVPMCIPKCSQENIDVFLVLHALLFKHNRNTKLFLDNNGLSLFTRELLHYDKCLQVLTTVAQCQAVSPLVFRDTAILTHLQDFIQQYGPRSQLGQKATIILNHIKSRTKGTTRKLPIVTETKLNTTSRDIQHFTNRSKVVNTTANIKASRNISVSKNISLIKTQNTIDDTNNLMQNVMREVFQWKQDEVAKLNKAVSKRNNLGKLKADKRKFVRNTNNNTFKNKNNSHRKEVHSDIDSELSFSFINNIKHYEARNIRNEESYAEPSNILIKNKDATEADDLNDFVPVFASTPKHYQETIDTAEANINETLPHQNTKTTYNTRKNACNSKLQKRKFKKAPQEKKDDKDVKNRTLSSKFFSVINDSCTTLVKSVKNMFTKKDNTDAFKDNQALDSTEDKFAEYKTCSQFSFTNYMKKRDEVLNSKILKKKMNSSHFSTDTGSCKTCDDTLELRKKLTKDDNLKKTIKKLKLGINLYGCDFKKISKTMWPRDSYMTPTVLYNLYRKLILK